MRLLEGQAHFVLAPAFLELGRQDEALGHAKQALDLYRQTRHRLGVARTLHVLGTALRDAGDPQAAARCWQEALELLTGTGSPEADALRTLLAS